MFLQARPIAIVGGARVLEVAVMLSEISVIALASSKVAVWCSGNALVLINAVDLHRARLVLGWATAFG